jgi:hypothetical protein
VQTFVTEYKKTPAKLKVGWVQGLLPALVHSSWAHPPNPPASVQVLDAFMVYALLTAAVQVRLLFATALHVLKCRLRPALCQEVGHSTHWSSVACSLPT